jgi:hypothetical protein
MADLKFGIFFFFLALAESARILAVGAAARSATNSPTQSGPSTYRGTTIQEEEDEIPLEMPSTTTSTTTSLTNGGYIFDVVYCGKEMTPSSVESPPSSRHNGPSPTNEITTAVAPLASLEDVTDSSVKENSLVDVPTSSSKSRDNPILIRLRQWTDRFSLNPVRPASAEPPEKENGITSSSSDVVPKSPKLSGSRKIVSTSLSRLFSRSPCLKGGSETQQQEQQQQSAANLVASTESNHLLFQESSTGHRLSKTINNVAATSADVSRSLDNVTAAAAHKKTDSTNHPTQNA